MKKIKIKTKHYNINAYLNIKSSLKIQYGLKMNNNMHKIYRYE